MLVQRARQAWTILVIGISDSKEVAGRSCRQVYVAIFSPPLTFQFNRNCLGLNKSNRKIAARGKISAFFSEPQEYLSMGRLATDTSLCNTSLAAPLKRK